MWRGAEATSHWDASSREPVFQAWTSPQVAAAPAEPVNPHAPAKLLRLLTVTDARTLTSVSLPTVGRSDRRPRVTDMAPEQPDRLPPPPEPPATLTATPELLDPRLPGRAALVTVHSGLTSRPHRPASCLLLPARSTADTSSRPSGSPSASLPQSDPSRPRWLKKALSPPPLTVFPTLMVRVTPSFLLLPPLLAGRPVDRGAVCGVRTGSAIPSALRRDPRPGLQRPGQPGSSPSHGPHWHSPWPALTFSDPCKKSLRA